MRVFTVRRTLVATMPFVSITRLHIALVRFLPGFFLRSLSIAKQACRTPGFLGGWLGNDPEWGLWTATVWESADAMEAFRRSGPHGAAMPKLLRWSDEAAFGHWEQADGTVPSADVVYDRMSREGRLSKLPRPSARQQAGVKVGRTKPRPSRILKPNA